MILDVCPHPGMGLGHAAELGLPIAIENDPVDVAAARVGLPAVRFRRVEVHVDGGAGWVVRIEHSLDGRFAHQCRG